MNLSHLKFYLILLILFLIIFIIIFIYRSKNTKKSTTSNLYTEALNAMILGDQKLALKLLKSVVKKDTNHISAYLQLGNIFRSENNNQALKIHRSLAIRPNLSDFQRIKIHEALAKDYLKMDNYKLAKTEAERVLKYDKKNIWALKLLLKVAKHQNEWDICIGLAKQIQKIKGENNKEAIIEFEILKANDYFLNGKINEAKNSLKKIIKNFPNISLSYLYLGDIYEESRDLVNAVKNWEKFAEKNPKNSIKIFKKIESGLFDLGLYSEVEKFYRKIIKINPSNIEAAVRLANVLEEKGENESALALIDSFRDLGKFNLKRDLMKIKLSLLNSTPIELSQQIDSLILNMENEK